MDIAESVTSEYVSFEPSTRLSKLSGAFSENPDLRVIVISGQDGFEGIVTQTQLLSSHHHPNEKARSAMRTPPRVNRTEDVRETARLMVESESKLLPVFEGDEIIGTITDRSLLQSVLPHLDALDVADVYTRDLIYVEPDTTLGEVINTLREHSITRVPIINDDTEAIGMASVFDLVDFTVREMQRAQGGSHEGFDEHGGTGSTENYNTHGGYGERSGFAARMLDLPVRDVMSSPVATIGPEQPLDEATQRMLDSNYSSLVVSSPDVTWPLGIMTTTDVLRALTWSEETQLPVQIFGVDLLTDVSRETITARIEEIDHKHSEMDIIEANVVLQQHDEQKRGTPLLLVTVRLFTDEGRFSGSGEGYGARAAFRAAAETLEENVLESKERNHPRRMARTGRIDVEKLVGWWLEV